MHKEDLLFVPILRKHHYSISKIEKHPDYVSFYGLIEVLDSIDKNLKFLEKTIYYFDLNEICNECEYNSISTEIRKILSSYENFESCKNVNPKTKIKEQKFIQTSFKKIEKMAKKLDLRLSKNK